MAESRSWLRKASGVAALAAGAGLLVLCLVTARGSPDEPIWPLVFLVGGVFLAGVLALKIPHALLERRFGPVSDEEVIGGSVFLFAGVSLTAIALVDGRISRPLSRLAVALPGLMFATGGVLILVGAVAKRAGRPSVAAPVLVALLVTLFAAAVTVLAFGPVLWGGERYPGCVAAPGAIFLVGLSGWLWREAWRSLKRARSATRD